MPHPQLGAAWRTFLGVRALSNPEKFVSGQFANAKVENAKANKARPPGRASFRATASVARRLPPLPRFAPPKQLQASAGPAAAVS